MKISLLVFGMIVLTSCAGNGMVRVGDAGFDGVEGVMGNGGRGNMVSWNEDYFVSAKHVIGGDRVSYEHYCDLSFVRRENNGKKALWRDGVVGERVMSVGRVGSFWVYGEGVNLDLKLSKIERTGDMYEHVSDGKNIEYPIWDTCSYKTHSATVIKGMSGGAVIGEDGEIIGMNVAYIPSKKAKDIKHEQDGESVGKYSLYIPYSFIKNQWEEYLEKSESQNLSGN